MSAQSIRKLIAAVLATSLPLASGCQTGGDWSFTGRLWSGDSFSRYKMPASEPRLELFADESHADVLVIYDEIREKDRQVRRRAFFVNPNLDRIAAGRHPHFVDPSAARGLKPIPILDLDGRAEIPPAGLAILRTERNHDFILYSEGNEVCTVKLPAYGSSGTVVKSLLTPLTVTSDTLIVVSVAGLILGLIYLQAGGPTTWHSHPCG